MIPYKTQRALPYSVEQLRSLILDVTSYPLFINIVESIHIEEHGTPKQNAQNPENFIARVNVNYKFIREAFYCRVTTANTNQPKYTKIEIAHIPSPHKSGAERRLMRTLTAVWEIEQRPIKNNANTQVTPSLVKFDLTFDLAVPAFNFFAKRKLARTSHDTLDAFEARAHQLYHSPLH